MKEKPHHHFSEKSSSSKKGIFNKLGKGLKDYFQTPEGNFIEITKADDSAKAKTSQKGWAAKVKKGLAYYPLTFYFGVFFIILAGIFLWLNLAYGTHFSFTAFFAWINDHALVFAVIGAILLGMILVTSAIAYKQVSNLSREDYLIWLEQRSTKTLFPIFTPLHDYFRLHFAFYRWWSVQTYASSVHVVLLVFIIIFAAHSVDSKVNPPTIVAGSQATQLVVTGAQNPSYIGASYSITVTAEDASNNVVTGYTGTVSLSSSDSLATLPSSYTFTTGDAGVHTFTGFKFGTAGTQSITASDTSNSISGTQSGITVDAQPSTITISGTGYSGISGTLNLAVNGSLVGQTGTAGTSWTISGVTTPTIGQSVMVYLTGATGTNETEAVTGYGGYGNMSGMVLSSDTITLGSADDATITNSFLSYDSTHDSAILWTASNTTDAGNMTLQSGNTYTPGASLTVSGTYSQTGGTFNGGSTPEKFADFTLSGGTFNATSGNLSLQASSAACNWTHTSGGTFNNDSGTVFVGTGSTSVCTSMAINVTNGGTNSEVFYNLTMDLYHNNTVTISTGNTLTVTNTFTLDSGSMNGGTVEAQNGYSDTTSGSGGTTTILIDGSTTRTITIAGTILPSFDLNAPNATINLSGSTTFNPTSLTLGSSSGNVNFGTTPVSITSGYSQSGGTLSGGSATDTITGGFTLSGGTFDATSGTMNVSGGWTHTSGGTFNNESGTVDFNGSGTVNVTNGSGNSETFYNLTIASGASAVTITSGNTLTTSNNLTMTSGIVNTGTIEVQNTMSNASTITGGGTGTILIDGSATRTITLTSAAGTGITLPNIDLNAPNVTVKNNSTGSVTLTSLTIGSSGGTFNDDIPAAAALKVTGFTQQAGTFAGQLSASSASTTDFGAFTLSGGTFNSPNNLNFDPNASSLNFAISNVGSGTTFNNESGTFTVDPSAGKTFNFTSGGVSFYNFAVAFGNGSATVNLEDSFTVSGSLTTQFGSTINTPNGAETITVAGNFTNSDSFSTLGNSSLTINLAGNYSMSGSSNVVAANIDFDSTSADQTFTTTADSNSKITGTITVAKNTNSVIQESATGTLGTVTVTSGKWYTNGDTFTATTLSLGSSGTFKINGNESLTITTKDTSHGTIEYAGSGTYSSLIYGNTYNNLLISGAGSFTAAASTTLSGSFTQSAGTFVAPSTTLTVAGSWTNSGGTYTANSGTVTLTGNASITGNTTFYNLTDTTAGTTLTFAASSTQTVTNTLTLTGTSGSHITLVSSTPGTKWNITPPTGYNQSSPTISYVTVSDSDNTNSASYYLNPSNSQEGTAGSTIGWFIPTTPTKLVWSSVPSTATAGSPFTMALSAETSSNAVVTTYTGTVHFTSTDGQAVVPSNYTFVSGDNGTHTFTNGFTLKTTGTQTVTANDSTNNINGTTSNITVNPGSLNNFTFGSTPSSETAGSSFTMSLTAKDAYGNTLTGYTGTVAFTSTDGQAVLPSNYTFVSGDSGSHTFTNGFTLKTAGSQTITATDSGNSVSSTTTGITVNAASAANLVFSSVPSSKTAGSAFTMVLTAKDTYGNTATGYTGTVSFTTTDSQGTFPSNYTFVSGDNGVHTFTNGFTLKTVGSWTYTATDSVNSLTGTTSSITVNPGAANSLVWSSVPASETAGTAFSMVLTAKDAYGNTATGYTGIVAFTSTDTQAVLPTNYTFTSGTSQDNGVHTFTNGFTLKTTPSQTITATDTNNSGITATTPSITVTAASSNDLLWSLVPTSVNAGSPFSLELTVQDQYGNTETGYTGTVHFTSTDGQAVLPSNYTFTSGTSQDNGTHTFTNGFTLKTAPTQTITATDTNNSGLTATTSSITVVPGSATTLVVNGISTPRTAGVPSNVVVTAQDQYGNTATSYTGTIHFTSTDGQATLPNNYTFTSGSSQDNGVHTFTNGVTLKTAGTQSVTATDTNNSGITGAETNILVNPSTAHALVWSSVPGSVTAGSAFGMTLTAQDQYGNTATGYTGTVHFTSTDGSATLPTNYTFTSGTSQDNGVHSFTNGFTLKTTPSQTITATDSVNSLTTTTPSITVTAASGTVLSVTGIPSPIVAGTSSNVVVTAKDSFGNTATTYTGTVHFTSSDGQATLPTNYTFVSGDNGTHTFTNGVTLKTTGTQSVTATDTNNSGITGAETGITVTASTANNFVWSNVPSSVNAGSPFTMTLTAKDQYGNTATGYTGTVHFTSTDGSAVLPTNYTYLSGDNGSHSFTNGFTLKTTPSQTVTATDTNNSSLTTTTSSITVLPGSATTLVVNGIPSPIVAGTSSNVVVTAQDQYGNTATGYTGTVHFTSTDGQATLPTNYTFVSGDNGVHTFTNGVTLKTAGTQSVTATDTNSGSISGSETGITVVGGGGSSLAWSNVPGSDTAGNSFTMTLSAKDQYGNTATSYTGTIAFTSTDTQATLPTNYTFVSGDNGSHSFTNGFTLKTSPTQTITATDTNNSSLTTTTGSITVVPGSATTLTVTGIPSSITAGTSNNMIVTAKDSFGNTATGYTGTVHFTSTDGQAILPSNYTFVSGDSGTHTFTNGVTLKTAGGQTVTATDTVTGSINGVETGITVNSATASTFTWTSVPASEAAGTNFTMALTAKDAYGNTATGYTGTVAFTSSDGQASLPTNYTFVSGDNGVHTFTNGFILKTTPSQTITATDTNNSGLTVTTSSITITSLSPSDFLWSLVPTSTNAGSPFSLELTAQDKYGNTATSYTGTVRFTSNDNQAALPANYTFTSGGGQDNGVHTFTNGFTLKTSPSQTITATDGVNNLSATTTSITVIPGSAAVLTVSGISSPFTAGTSSNVVVTAQDQYGNTATGYTGTVHFTSTDGQASLPTNYTFVSGDNGVHTFTNGVTLKTAGSQSVTATDTVTGSISGSETGVTVNPATARSFSYSSTPGSVSAGVAFTLGITAKDAYGNTATGYTGVAHFTSSDGQAVLPANYTFVSGDNGSHTFTNGFALKTAPSQTITVVDNGDNSIAGTTSSITVTPGNANSLVLSSFSSSATAGTAFSMTVTAKDQYGNTAPSYRGTVQFSSTDGQAVLPTSYTFVSGDNGVHGFTNGFTLKTAGPQTITATDSGNGFVITTGTITVSAGAAKSLVLSGAPSSQPANTTFSLTLTAKDSYGNVATGYTDTAHFTSNDGNAILPGDYTFTNTDAGVHTFTNGFKLETIGSKTITATDASNGTVNSSQVTIPVTVVAPTVSATPSANPTGPQNWYTTAPQITLNATDFSGTGIAAIYYRWGTTGNYSIYSTPLTILEGSNNLYYYATDNNGDSGAADPSSSTYKLDTTPPTMDGITPVTKSPTNQLTDTFTWSPGSDGNGSGVDHYLVTIGSTPSGNDIENNELAATNSLTETFAAPGTYYISVEAVDLVGLVSQPSSTGLVWIDTTNPNINVSNFAQSGFINQTSTTLTGTTTDLAGVSAVQVQIDGGSWQDADSNNSFANWTYNWNNYTDGKHSIVVKATDNAGNTQASQTYNVTVDTVAPTKPTVSAFDVSDRIAGSYQTLVSWPASTDAISGVKDYTIYRDGTQVAQTTNTYFVDQKLGANSYTYTVAAEDNAGNSITSDGATVSLTGNSALQTQISDIAAQPSALVDNSGNTTATITWKTSQPTTSQVDYGLSAAKNSQTPLTTELNMGHQIILTNLTANTTYHYEVISKDIYGNTVSSGDMTFTTSTAQNQQTVLDVILRTIQNFFQGLNTAMAADLVKIGILPEQISTNLIAYDVSIPTANVYQSFIVTSGQNSTTISRSTDGVNFSTVGSSSNGYYLDQSLKPNTTYYYKAAGQSGVVSVRPGGVDTTPPSITNIQASSLEVANDSADYAISWDTDKLSTSAVTINGQTLTDSSLNQSHVITVTGLKPGQNYTYEISSTSQSGTTSNSSKQALQVSAAPQPQSVWETILKTLQNVFGGFGSWLQT